MIYADNAATTKLDPDAFEAMRPFLLENYANASQPYSFAKRAKRALREARAAIAECIGASPEEIYFTSGGTESDNWAIKGLVGYGGGQTIITSAIEHHAVLNACGALEKAGCPVIYLPVCRAGLVSPETLKHSITPETKLVSVMMANNEIGTIEPIAELAGISHENGAVFHTDAVQAAGHVPVDVKALGIDMLSASGHKFNAPKGIGFLYIKRGTPIKPCTDGGAQEFGMRAGTENIASIAAMALALKKNCAQMAETAERLLRMEQTLLQALTCAGVEYIRNGAESHIPGIINLSIKNANGEMLLHRLDLKGICVSTGSACDSVNTQVSHVIRAIAVPHPYAEGTIRISFGRDNTEKDAVAIARSVADILQSNGSGRSLCGGSHA